MSRRQAGREGRAGRERQQCNRAMRCNSRQQQQSRACSKTKQGVQRNTAGGLAGRACSETRQAGGRQAAWQHHTTNTHHTPKPPCIDEQHPPQGSTACTARQAGRRSRARQANPDDLGATSTPTYCYCSNSCASAAPALYCPSCCKLTDLPGIHDCSPSATQRMQNALKQQGKPNTPRWPTDW